MIKAKVLICFLSLLAANIAAFALPSTLSTLLPSGIQHLWPSLDVASVSIQYGRNEKIVPRQMNTSHSAEPTDGIPVGFNMISYWRSMLSSS
jgi:hypothetical protein